VGAAWLSLNACRLEFRGREHAYLYTLFNRNQQTLKGHNGAVTSVAFGPCGRRTVSGGWDSTPKVWDEKRASWRGLSKGTPALSRA